MRSALTLVLFLVSSSVLAEELVIRKIDGKFPDSSAIKVGSGSGVIIGPRSILTNQHVVLNDNGSPAEGFNIYLGPKYSDQPKQGRVVAVCDNFDLALIELSDPIPNAPVMILDGIPPLGERVTAFGFPLASSFGVALTATGGQVSRLPISNDAPAVTEREEIGRALWHDAVIASGSSGGALVSDSGILLGINYARLKDQSNYALAVPGSVVAAFVDKCGNPGKAKFVELLKGNASEKPPELAYIEILSSGAGGESRRKASDATAVSGVILDKLRSQLTSMSLTNLKALHDGRIADALTPTTAATMKASQVVRIKASMTIIQVMESGMLVELDGVRCKILFLKNDGAELAAKFGDEIVTRVTHDGVYYVGKATAYTTVVGKTSYYIPLARVSELISLDEVQTLVAPELASRREADAKESVRRRLEQAEAKARTAERNLTKVRRTFSDKSGRFSVDAACVSLDGDRVGLVRMSDKQRISVQLATLCDEDRVWLRNNESWIRVFGASTEEFLKE